MIRGQKAKQEIFTKIQELFPDSFMDNKDLRINTIEDGELVQIKLTLTASKTIVKKNDSAPVKTDVIQGGGNVTAPTAEEKARVESMIRALGGRIK